MQVVDGITESQTGFETQASIIQQEQGVKSGGDGKGFVQIEFILKIGLQQVGIAFEIRDGMFGLSTTVSIIKSIVGGVLIAENDSRPKDMPGADLFVE
jgi:hypothetical protein